MAPPHPSLRPPLTLRVQMRQVATMSSDASLDRIGLHHGTDKSSAHHGYLDFYERFFGPERASLGKLLEIGVFSGQSIRMWREYFPNATIIGADIEPDAQRHATDRITIELADQSNVADLVRLGTRHGPFDIVVDDGSHVWDHQILTLQYLYPFVRPGGFYVLEDIDTSYGSFADQYRGLSPISTAHYLHRLADYLVGDAVIAIADEPDGFIRSYARSTEFIALHRRTALLRRKPA